MSHLTDLLAELGIELDPQLLDLAFTHRSWAYENGRCPTNERLEFLGDAVLGVIVTEHIYLTYPDRSEGQLARLRSAVVSGHALSNVARQLGLGPLIKLGRGEVATRGQDKDSILADVTEAVIGAVHLTGGWPASTRFVHRLVDPAVQAAAGLGAGLDWKSSLQELVSAAGWAAPTYVSESTGPDHSRHFYAEVLIDGRSFGPGESTSKRGAEQQAAELAYRVLSAAAEG